MLLATTHGFNFHGFNFTEFTISQDGVELVKIEVSWFRPMAKVKIDKQTYTVYRKRFLQDVYVLESESCPLARAQWEASTRAFEVYVYFADRRLELRELSAWKNQFGLFESGAQIGDISPTSWWGRKVVIDLPGDIPIPVQVFLFWIVTDLWWRESPVGG